MRHSSYISIPEHEPLIDLLTRLCTNSLQNSFAMATEWLIAAVHAFTDIDTTSSLDPYFREIDSILDAEHVKMVITASAILDDAQIVRHGVANLLECICECVIRDVLGENRQHLHDLVTRLLTVTGYTLPPAVGVWF